MTRNRAFFLICTAFLFTLSVRSYAAVHDTVPRQFVLEGKIIDTVSIPPYCGYIAFASAVRMEIISFSDTSYKQKQIVVIFMCPREKGESYFNVGQVHAVTVQDQNPASFGWAIMDQEKLSENNLAYYLYVVELN